MAREITSEGALPGYDQVAQIERWLCDDFEYAPGSSFTSLSAIEVNQQSTGVCRDFSHLGVALTRALSIPARMVVGYLHGLDPMEMHAWFEAYVADRWYTFDATRSSKAVAMWPLATAAMRRMWRFTTSLDRLSFPLPASVRRAGVSSLDPSMREARQ
jgi:transglutaminase-like putative cysteine protease